MAGGHRNVELEERIRRILKRPKMQAASDREVAKEADCSKNAVRRVRTVMIHAGLLPAKSGGTPYAKGPVAIRGGYVMLPSGKIITVVEHQKRKKRH